VRIVRKLTTGRAVCTACVVALVLAVAAVFALGVTPLVVAAGLVCLLTMAPAVWIAGEVYGRRPR
jgi:hypothetical protein